MTFKPNEAGFRELETATRDLSAAAAEQIAERARSYAPVRTGAYRDSIEVRRDGDEVVVGSDVPYAVYVEFGTADTPTFAPLTRAASEARVE